MEDNYNIELRSLILKYSIELEELASIYISRLLFIDDWQNTKSFGIGSSSLSFYQKIQLINDISSSRIDNAKINCFQIIRNKLMHTAQYNSLNEIAKNYPVVRKIIDNDKTEDENVLKLKTESLFKELKKQIRSLNDITTSDALTILKSNLSDSLFKENDQLSLKLEKIKNLSNVKDPNWEEIKTILNTQ